MKLAVLAASVTMVGSLIFNTGRPDPATVQSPAPPAPATIQFPAPPAPATIQAPAPPTPASTNKLDTDKYPMEKTLEFAVRSLSPEIVTDQGPSSLTISAAITNTGEFALSDLIARVQRGTKQKDYGAVQRELANPTQPEFVRPKDFSELKIDLLPGQTREISVTVPLVGSAADSLRITAPGVYPLLLNINATVTTPKEKYESRVGGLYLMLSVTSVPTVTAPATGRLTDILAPTTVDVANKTAPPGSAPLQVNTLWPVMDRIHRGPDGSFFDDDLAESIRTGGRLDTVLAVLEAASPPAGAVTLVIDPELLEELESMSQGYVVGAAAMDLDAIAEQLNADGTSPSDAPSTTEGPTTASVPAPTSTDTSNPPATDPTETVSTESAGADPTSSDIATVPEQPLSPGQTRGSGSADAERFLDRLTALVGTYQAVVVPYSDPDIAALSRASQTSLLSDTVIRGREIADRILGASGQLIYNLGWPMNGTANPATAVAFRQVGITAMILGPSGVTSRDANAQLVASTGPMNIVVTDRLIDEVIDPLLIAGWSEQSAALMMNSLAARTVQLGLGGSGRTMVYAPDRQWLPNAAGVRTWFSFLTTLDHEKLVAGTSLRSIAQRPGDATELRYSEDAIAAELGQGTLARVATLRSQTQSINDALVRTTSTGFEPLGVLDPILHNLSAAASNSFRSDPILTAKWRKPLEDVLAQISSRVSIVTPASSYTLTSTSSPIILRLSNDLPFDIRVKVKIVNPERVGLDLQPPQEQIIPALRSRQIEIPATVNKPGQYAVTAVILTPDNLALGSPTVLQLNSTAYGTFTITLMITAGAVLVLTVGWRIGQRWKNRRERIRAEQAAAAA